MTEFDDIRPYQDDEVKGVIAGLLADKEFLDFLSSYYFRRLNQFALPGISWILRKIVGQVLKRQLGHVTNVQEFQQAVSNYARRVVSDTMTSFTYEGIDQLHKDKAYLFVSNHRDIAGDSMLVDYALWNSGFETVRIAVGDNLVQRDFATALMKLNKSFFIKRSVEGAKKIFAALLQSSKYIHQSIEQGHSVWIAQSEGRAKDGIDETDPTIIKMFALADRKAPLKDVIGRLGIVPVSISYEFDPCDCLKAKELYTVATEGRYEKPPGEDLKSLVKGLGDFKGRVVLRFGKVLDEDFQSADEVANAIDRQVLDLYELFPVNYWALKQLASGEFDNEAGQDGTDNSGVYEELWKTLGGSVDLQQTAEFEKRLEDCQPEWRRHFLMMYANPVVNKYRAKSTHLAPRVD